MKKIINFSLIIVLSIAIFSCKNEKKQKEKPVAEASYSIDAEKSSVQWTGYKTTDKVAVNGTFKEISILEMNSGNTATDALGHIQNNDAAIHRFFDSPQEPGSGGSVPGAISLKNHRF